MFGSKSVPVFGWKIVQGYPIDEVVSALQKECRRGNFSNASYWANVLYEEGYWNAAFNRLKIITMEDASAFLNLPLEAERLFQAGRAALQSSSYKGLKATKNIPKCRDVLMVAVDKICQAPKSRSLNHALTLVRKTIYDESDSKPPEGFVLAPTFIKTLENAVRVLILDDSVMIQNMWDTLKLRAIMTQSEDIELIKILQKWSTLNESLAVAHALAVLYHSDVPQFVRRFDFQPIRSFVKPQERLEIPDYAVDKHTRRGKQMGRDIVHFYEEGSRVTNELFPDPWVDEARRWLLELHTSGIKASIMKLIREKWHPVKKRKRNA